MTDVPHISFVDVMKDQKPPSESTPDLTDDEGHSRWLPGAARHRKSSFKTAIVVSQDNSDQETPDINTLQKPSASSERRNRLSLPHLPSAFPGTSSGSATQSDSTPRRRASAPYGPVPNDSMWPGIWNRLSGDQEPEVSQQTTRRKSYRGSVVDVAPLENPEEPPPEKTFFNFVNYVLNGE